jgi:hypothetical protein
MVTSTQPIQCYGCVVRGNLGNVAIVFRNSMKLVAKFNMCFYSKVRVDISGGISIYDWFYIRWLSPTVYFWIEINEMKLNEINVYRKFPIQNGLKLGALMIKFFWYVTLYRPVNS